MGNSRSSTSTLEPVDFEMKKCHIFKILKKFKSEGVIGISDYFTLISRPYPGAGYKKLYKDDEIIIYQYCFDDKPTKCFMRK